MGKIWNPKSILAGTSALLAFTSWLPAADWAQWRGPNRDGHVAANQPIPESLPDGVELLSRSQACGTTWCSPAYADGRLYVRDARALFCLQVMP
jgi:hypothetical protein